MTLSTIDYSGTGLQVPLTEPSGTGAGVGPFGMFGWLRGLSTGVLQCVINGGRGGSHTSQWLPGGAFYTSLVARAWSALNATGTVAKGFLVYIGPNDALEANPDWIGNTRTTLAALRATFGDLPAIFVRLAADPPVPPGPSWDSVAAQIVAIADAQNILVTPPAHPDQDGLHYSTQQNYVIAQSALAAWPFPP